MKKVAIVTDGVCDLSKEIIEEYGIITIPYRVIFGEDIYRVWHNGKYTISIGEFCDKLAKTTKENLPRTSIPSPGEFKEAFDEAFKQAESVIAIILTSKMSGAVQTAQTVINNFFKDKDIAVFDSLQTMTGTGILALEAAKLAKDGKTKQEILARLESISPRVRTILAMNDLDYLEKQGRLGPIQNIREKNPAVIPVIHLKDGILQPLTIFQNEADMITRLQVFAEKIIEQNETGEIFLTHINHHQSSKVMYDILIKDETLGRRVHYYEANAILGVYSGPHTICISYIGNFDKDWL
ncbi:MAG: DegV family protein [Candidatus Heimdallarchaeota archaeon]|nr:DegV family protein [Candidatus Heimdallarchaeota archaeon]